MRYIDADALKETIVSNVYPVADAFNSRDYGMFWTGGIEKAIDQQPTADVRENVKGEWIEVLRDTYGGGPFPYSKCSVCQSEQIMDSNFCPNCGADMRGESNGKT